MWRRIYGLEKTPLNNKSIFLSLYFEIQSTFNMKQLAKLNPEHLRVVSSPVKRKSSIEWIYYFKNNLLKQRVDWTRPPSISPREKSEIISSVQAWQLGETSDGSHLLKAAGKYAQKINDPDYLEAVKLFIKEEQKHGSNLGKYLDAIGVKRLKKNWGDSLFRSVRYFNTSMELWTIAVIIVESLAQLFYKSVKDATECNLLKEICSDILQDEVQHIVFQSERLRIIYQGKSKVGKQFASLFYFLLFYTIILTVWIGHSRAFKAGGNTFPIYLKRITAKFNRMINLIYR